MKDYKKVKYNGKKYCVCRYKHSGRERLFVIDASDLKKILKTSKTWYKISTYVGCVKKYKDNLNITHFLHNIVYGMRGGGKNKFLTHINRINNDNRKVNLELLPKLDKVDNQDKKERMISLPKGCGIKKTDIPRGIWFDKSRERFVIELKKDNKTVVLVKMTGNKNYTIKEKLNMAKKQLKQIYKKNPELKTKKYIDSRSHKIKKLAYEFNEIIRRSGYKCAKNNMVKVK